MAYKARSNVIARYLIFFFVEICARQSDLSVNRRHGYFSDPTNWHWMKQVLSMKPSNLSWREKNCTTPSPCFTLEVYDETPIFSPVHIKEEVVESFMRKLSGSSGPGGTDSEALQGWLLKSREDIKRLRTSVENFSD